MTATIIRGGYLVDPANGREGHFDVLLREGRVAEIAPEVSDADAEEIDARGRLVIPGIIDCHVHLSNWLGGPPGHRMLALAGVTTALDLAGPIADVVDITAKSGCGLTIGCIDYVRPGHTVSSADPEKAELQDALTTATNAGALGQKILGGHFPLTPDATARVIEVAAERGTYVAFHAGTLEQPQNIAGMHEACELTRGNPLHLAHINSYARGLDASAHEEAEAAIEMLAARANIWSESYLAPFNGNSGKCAQGVPESVATQRNVARGGFEPTTNGLAEAIRQGWALVHVKVDGVNQLAGGEQALSAWREAETDIGLSFYANPFEARVKLATDKRADGRFAIDALATDGGGVPRNDLCLRGLALTRLEGLSLSDFVHKVCIAPARMLGLSARKGHLGTGADADVTIIDGTSHVPVSSFVHGRPILRDREVVGRGGQFLTLPEGVAAVSDRGLDVIELGHGTMLPGKSLD